MGDRVSPQMPFPLTLSLLSPPSSSLVPKNSLSLQLIEPTAQSLGPLSLHQHIFFSFQSTHLFFLFLHCFPFSSIHTSSPRKQLSHKYPSIHLSSQPSILFNRLLLFLSSSSCPITTGIVFSFFFYLFFYESLE